MIILFATYGLGNRMRTIASTVEIAKRTNHKLRVFWPIEDDLCAAFEDIFEPVSSFHIKSFVCGKKKHNLICHFFKYPRMHNLFKMLIVNGDYILSKSSEQLQKEFNFYKLIIIRTCYELVDDYALDVLRFNSKVIANSVMNDIAKKHLIGVHIRRTDSFYSIDNSSTDLFIRRMNALKEIESSIVFYLASDDQTEKDRLKALFNSQVITQPVNSFNRNSKEAIIDAATEFYNLSKCRLVLASFGSSFSQLAARYGNHPIEVISDNVERESRKWFHESFKIQTLPHLSLKEQIAYNWELLRLLFISYD